MQFKGTMKNRGMVNVNVSYKNQQSIVYQGRIVTCVLATPKKIMTLKKS